MSLSYFPMFPSDFDGKTAHLSFAEDGAYNRLLRISWGCPEAKLPDDIEWICRKARAVTDEDKRMVAALLSEFFTRKGRKIFSEKLHGIWCASNEAYNKRVLAGKMGGSAKSLKSRDLASSNARAMLGQCSSNQNQNQNQKEIEEREAIASPKKPSPKASRMSGDWQIPGDWISESVAKGCPEQIAIRESDRFKNYWLGKAGREGFKLDWRATWRNWIGKRIDELPHQPVFGGSNGWYDDRNIR
jgi:uncharacterized protein YdaU (DUF1376 family)